MILNKIHWKIILEIAKSEGTDEKTLINDILSEAIREYDNHGLLKKINEAEAIIEEEDSISIEELAESIDVYLGKLKTYSTKRFKSFSLNYLNQIKNQLKLY